MEVKEIHKQLLDGYTKKFNVLKEEMLDLLMFHDWENDKIANKANELFCTSKTIEFLKEKTNG